MRPLVFGLLVLILLIQYPLWLGRGGMFRVWEMERQIDVQRRSNDRAQARNSALDAEVRDLKQGLEALEERARSELGMIRDDEIFFQVIEKSAAGNPAGKP